MKYGTCFAPGKKLHLIPICDNKSYDTLCGRISGLHSGPDLIFENENWLGLDYTAVKRVPFWERLHQADLDKVCIACRIKAEKAANENSM